MRKTLIVIMMQVFTSALIAQGTVNLQSYVGGPNGYSITIYSEDYNNPGEAEISGNGIQDIPSGSATYANETPIGGTASGSGAGASGVYNGNSYTVGFYLATSASALQAQVNSGMPSYSTLMDTTFGTGQSGTYDPTDEALLYKIPNDPDGTPTYVAMAAWYSAGGVGSYAAAVAANVPRGDVFATQTITPQDAPYVPPNLKGLGLTSFDLVVNVPQVNAVPEPSVVELGSFAACGFLLHLRNRNSKKSLELDKN